MKEQPAFPVQGFTFDTPQGPAKCAPYPGLSKRELFAAMAMQGFCALPAQDVEHANLTPDKLASWAVAHADALIAELSKENQS